jgi:hypothetical protein
MGMPTFMLGSAEERYSGNCCGLKGGVPIPLGELIVHETFGELQMHSESLVLM